MKRINLLFVMDIFWIKKIELKKGNFCILMFFWGENVYYNWKIIYLLDVIWWILMFSYIVVKVLIFY